MAALCIASKANQATTVPALLISNYANQLDHSASIDIQFEEVEILQSGNGASVKLAVANDTPAYGSEQVISKLSTTYHLLQGKHEILVCYFNSASPA